MVGVILELLQSDTDPFSPTQHPQAPPRQNHEMRDPGTINCRVRCRAVTTCSTMTGLTIIPLAIAGNTVTIAGNSQKPWAPSTDDETKMGSRFIPMMGLHRSTISPRPPTTRCTGPRRPLALVDDQLVCLYVVSHRACSDMNLLAWLFLLGR